ncbi:MAG: YceI family protein [Cyclobacteriaceae bacterium]
MKRLLLLTFVLASVWAEAQKFRSHSSNVTFFSEASVEDIAAKNIQGSSIFNAETGEVVFLIPINQFEFEKSLMQEHFNEKYLESDKYPKATFEGLINGYNLSIGTSQPASAKGKLTIHGVTREVALKGTLLILGDRAKVNAKFTIRLEDYKIKIPKLLWSNIAEEVDVEVDFDYSKM